MAEDPADIPNIDDEAPGPSTGEREPRPGAAAAPPPKPAAPGLFARLRARRARNDPESAPSRCVIIGPTGSGKTLMLVSLDPSVDKEVHSYAERLKVTLHGNNADFEALEQRREQHFTHGLTLPGGRFGECFLPEFTLVITERKTKKQTDTRFRTFDGPGGLIVAEEFERADVTPEALACRRKLMQALTECETVMLCLPIDKSVTLREQRALKSLLHEFRTNRQIRRLVVCLTMYEKLGLGLGRHAFRLLANRTAAKERMRHALQGNLSAVNNVLEQFHLTDAKRSAWCVPVSTYGFIPNNGGANVERLINRLDTGHEEVVERLRVWPTQSERAHPSIQSIPTYDEDTARTHLWRPFLTLDPFIFIATGNRQGTLIHRYDEIAA
jgi:hypothetical protein